jgi:hypothetical protein
MLAGNVCPNLNKKIMAGLRSNQAHWPRKRETKTMNKNKSGRKK